MSDAETIKWEEVESAAANMFNIWVGGNELKWAKEAWSHLTAAAGLNNATTLVEITATKLRLVTLGRIYHEFCGLAWDENPDWPVSYLTENLEIDPVALGILAASTPDRNEFEEVTEDCDLTAQALMAVVNSQRSEIFDCLSAAYGDAYKLYSRIWHTLSDDAEKDSEGDEFRVTEANVAAMDYVVQGFHSDRSAINYQLSRLYRVCLPRRCGPRRSQAIG
jgi:hypothetical protein